MHTATRLAIVLCLAAAAALAPAGAAQAVTAPRTLYAQRAVGAAAVSPGFAIDYVGVVLDLPAGHGHAHEAGEHPGVDGVQVRLRSGGRWGRWSDVAEDGAQAVGQWTGALVAARGAEAYQVRGVPELARSARAAAINVTDGPQVVVGHRPAGAADAATACKARVDWGADESLRTSTRSYAPLQVMTVHHTATENDDANPDARVRAIYEYHVRTNGWDDIGYQALVSEDGTVYEGRWSGSDSPSCLTAGGTTTPFGHASDGQMVTGAHTGGYNTGNFGVALLGTFTSVAPKAAARSAAVDYLAELSTRSGVDPNTQVLYDNGTNSKTVWTISGHRDFVASECPGGTFYDDLPVLRSDVAAATTTDGGGEDVTIAAAVDRVTQRGDGGKQRNLHLVVDVYVDDADGAPVAGASVSLRTSGTKNNLGPVTATTGSNGWATYKWTNVRKDCYQSTAAVTAVPAGYTADGTAVTSTTWCK